MRWVLALAIAASAVSGCSKEQGYPPVNEQEVQAGEKAKAALSAGLDKVRYPKCDRVFDKAKITPCGKATYKAALAECRQRALTYLPGGSLLDEYAGDSWQSRAGSIAIKSDDQRLEFAEGQGPRDLYLETLAVAKGNGTDDIAKVSCDLDSRFHLTRVSNYTDAN